MKKIKAKKINPISFQQVCITESFEKVILEHSSVYLSLKGLSTLLHYFQQESHMASTLADPNASSLEGVQTQVLTQVESEHAYALTQVSGTNTTTQVFAGTEFAVRFSSFFYFLKKGLIS